jgi:hypothetical protein
MTEMAENKPLFLFLPNALSESDPNKVVLHDYTLLPGKMVYCTSRNRNLPS